MGAGSVGPWSVVVVADGVDIVDLVVVLGASVVVKSGTSITKNGNEIIA